MSRLNEDDACVNILRPDRQPADTKSRRKSDLVRPLYRVAITVFVTLRQAGQVRTAGARRMGLGRTLPPIFMPRSAVMC